MRPGLAGVSALDVWSLGWMGRLGKVWREEGRSAESWGAPSLQGPAKEFPHLANANDTAPFLRGLLVHLHPSPTPSSSGAK